MSAPYERTSIYLERSFEIVPLLELPQTEETICQQKIDELAAHLMNQGYFPTPIIASRNPQTKKILPLDGNHRRSAGSQCGLHYLPVMFVDWGDFKIDVWNRAVHIPNPAELGSLLSQFNLTQVTHPTGSGQTLFFYGGKSYCFGSPLKTKLEQHQETEKLFKALAKTGINIENFAKVKTETDDLKQDPAYLVVELSKFEKNELIDILTSGVILPPKAYRTILPHGPLRLPIKMENLKALNDIAPNHLKRINEDLTAELKQIPFIELPNEIDVSDNHDKFYAPLKLAPLVANPKARFKILDQRELNKLSPLNLRYSIIRIFDPPSDFQQRLNILTLQLEVSIKILKEKGRLARLYIEGPVIMNLENVFELCHLDSPLEDGIARVLADYEAILNAIKLSMHVVFLSKDLTLEHNMKYPYSPS